MLIIMRNTEHRAGEEKPDLYDLMLGHLALMKGTTTKGICFGTIARTQGKCMLRIARTFCMRLIRRPMRFTRTLLSILSVRQD